MVRHSKESPTLIGPTFIKSKQLTPLYTKSNTDKELGYYFV